MGQLSARANYALQKRLRPAFTLLQVQAVTRHLIPILKIQRERKKQSLTNS